jgi:predicted Zn-dependent protease
MGAPILAEMAQPLIPSLEKLIGTARDGALLRYSLGNEYLKAGDPARAAEQLREAVKRDPDYSAAWKVLGRALADSGEPAQAIEAWGHGIEAARRKGDRQAEKEMTVFSRRLARSANRDRDPA